MVENGEKRWKIMEKVGKRWKALENVGIIGKSFDLQRGKKSDPVFEVGPELEGG
ncbi:MAG: hypothetical protein LBE27_05595 [Deltaproteobacteria bacterium]|jgi:hypothetical protein|nr:hypothetical protein [Deltaproteobacteria bacterium]